MGFKKRFESSAAYRQIGRGIRDHGRQGIDRSVYRVAHRPRRAVHVFDRWREAHQKHHRALGAAHGVLAGHGPDLGNGFPDPGDGRLGLPAEGVAPKAASEFPGGLVGPWSHEIAVLSGVSGAGSRRHREAERMLRSCVVWIVFRRGGVA